MFLSPVQTQTLIINLRRGALMLFWQFAVARQLTKTLNVDFCSCSTQPTTRLVAKVRYQLAIYSLDVQPSSIFCPIRYG